MTTELLEKPKKMTVKEVDDLAYSIGCAMARRGQVQTDLNLVTKTIGDGYCYRLNNVMTFNDLKDGVISLSSIMGKFHVKVFRASVEHKMEITKDADEKTRASAIQSAKAGVSNLRNLLQQGMLCYHHNRDEAIRLTDATLRKETDNKSTTPSEVAESISGKVKRLAKVNKTWLATLGLTDMNGHSLIDLFKVESELQAKMNATRDSIRGVTEQMISDIVPMDFKALFEKVKFSK